MRVLLSIVVTLGLAFVMYLIFLRSASPNGGTPQSAISTTTVQVQLVNLAQAERIYFAENSSYATLEQLSSSGAFKLPNPDPDGYTYSVEVSGSGFIATAQHATAPGKRDDYPTFTIDQTMQVRHGGDPGDPHGDTDKRDEIPGDVLAPAPQN